VKILGRLDYRVIEAPDARAALSVLSAGEKIDLLLSDVVLPGGVSGPELAQTARESDPALKVMFMSGYSDGALNGNGQWSSDAVVLSKPFPSRELAEKVRMALGH
jgi:CheY-like chemotaxis protein